MIARSFFMQGAGFVGLCHGEFSQFEKVDELEGKVHRPHLRWVTVPLQCRDLNE